MAKLIYFTPTSLDGYIADEPGNYDWGGAGRRSTCLHQRSRAPHWHVSLWSRNPAAHCFRPQFGPLTTDLLQYQNSAGTSVLVVGECSGLVLIKAYGRERPDIGSAEHFRSNFRHCPSNPASEPACRALRRERRERIWAEE